MFTRIPTIVTRDRDTHHVENLPNLVSYQLAHSDRNANAKKDNILNKIYIQNVFIILISDGIVRATNSDKQTTV